LENQTLQRLAWNRKPRFAVAREEPVMDHAQQIEPSGAGLAERKPWVSPEIKDLPKLTDLTLLTGSPIPGGGGTGGTTVF
jgi:hypothetical protein